MGWRLAGLRHDFVAAAVVGKKAKRDRQLTASTMRCAVCMLLGAEILLVSWRNSSVVRKCKRQLQ